MPQTQRSSPPPMRAAAFAAVFGAVAFLAADAGAQSAPLTEADSLVLTEIRDAQRAFEEFRESKIPVHVERNDVQCDARIGWSCIWFGGEEESDFPAEFREVQQARVELIRNLFDAFEKVPNRWTLGQLVHYLVERRDVDEAERVASECGIEEEWWCLALRGYALHVRTVYLEAETAFRDALAAMPDSVWFEWTTPRYILTPEALEVFESKTPLERELQWELFWRLSDPLFLFEGNDRLTDHFARLVEAENKRDAATMGRGWNRDNEEALVRYGRHTGYSRSHNPARIFSGGGVNDTRRLIGHHHPKSRGYLFPEEFLESPAEIPPESWITAPREARTWYAPPYAPEIRGLETQVGRFRRDDRMLVVGAYRPTVENRDGEVVSAWDGDDGIEGEPHAALFLIPEDGEQAEMVRGRDPEGVFSILVWPTRYVSSIEVVDLDGRQAWRARQGVVQHELLPGMVDVSDVMILREDAPIPATLDEAIPLVRPGVRVRSGERFVMMWEAYGVRIQEPIQVTIGFSAGRPGFLQRVGEFLGVIDPQEQVDITFEDVGPDQVQSIFRAIELQWPEMEPGEYTLHLRLDLPGRTPLVTSRPVIVEG